ncbi:MAG: chromate resistance protein ChrB [Actinobacteria bacterium]|nr:chromate resistance protein ChrB [Actinomycetota bacterium]
MDWLVLSYRLPTEPSRYRVAAWRELRRAGAVSLQQGTWAAPDGSDFRAAITRAVEIVEAAEGEAIVMRATPDDDASAGALENLFTQERDAEWMEFLADCDKFEQEISREIRQEKFTTAELDEEEQSYERLRRWLREIRTRDVFGASSAPVAERRLKECAQALGAFCERVYEEGAR